MSRLKFAVVREDPQVEAELIRQRNAEAVLLVASGGCTALSLKTLIPTLDVTAFDFNPTQLAHVEAKASAVVRGDLAALNVGNTDRRGFNQSGDFEGLFRTLRSFLREFVLTEEELSRFFSREAGTAERAAMLDRWRSSPYWAAAFHVTFADGFLHAMFGPAATQHAERGSYPGYFQKAFERGLERNDAATNPFLQHVLLGSYLRPDAPAYVSAARELPLKLVEGPLTSVRDLERFDLIHLSNIFDWSDDALVSEWAQTLTSHARPGATIVIRQLNNRRNLRRFFEPTFTFDDALGTALVERDRSLFYERIEVGMKVHA